MSQPPLPPRRSMPAASATALLALALMSCGGGGSSSASTPSPTGLPSTPTTITLMHYNDLHAHLTPHWDRVPDAATGTKIVERGGIARLATLVKQIRAENPNSILMNIGDTYHGGVEALYTLGNAVAAPVNALGIDVGVPGNWDFAYGPIVTRLRYASLSAAEQAMLSLIGGVVMATGDIAQPNFPNLAANVTYTAPFFNAGQPFLPPTWTTNRAGVQIGFIGITSDIVPRMSPTLATGLAFVQGENNYRALIEQHAAKLRAQGAQLVFVMSELGIHKDKRLADVVAPGSVDVFFSAHTHEATFTPLTGASGALVVEAGNDGYLGRMDVTVAAGAAPVFRWQLLPLDRSIPEDAAMKALVDQARAPFLVPNPNIKLPFPYVDVTLTQPINTVVGTTAGPLDRRQALDYTFNRVFAAALRTRGGTQLAMTPGFRFDSVLGAPGEMLEDNTLADGTITLEDVYRFFPVVYTLSTGAVSGQRLLDIAELGLTGVYSRTAFNQSGGWFDGFGGLGLNVDIAGADGTRVRSAWLADSGAAIEPSATYTITGCTRPDDSADTLCSYTGFTNVQPLINPTTGSAWTVTDMFIDLLASGPLPAAGPAQIIDESNTPVWPQAPFVQPIW
ncbi:MAG: bifunctional metallophosphatase/5'-nucleotidase [Gammaproteobacteria bacterium]